MSGDIVRCVHRPIFNLAPDRRGVNNPLTRLEDSVIQVGKSMDEFMFSCIRGMRDLAEDTELSSGDRNARQENFLRYIHSFPYSSNSCSWTPRAR
jgi:hypothetical protein